MFKQNQRLMHRNLGEVEVEQVDGDFMRVKKVDSQTEKKYWNTMNFRISDCKQDFTPIREK